MPYTLFMTPPLARVGLTERDARGPGAGCGGRDARRRDGDGAAGPHRRRGPRNDEGRGRRRRRPILGAALLSYDSHEVINMVSLAMRHGITATQLRDEIYTHPSMTEAFNQLLGAAS